MCISPIIKKNKEWTTARNRDTTPVPCGNCVECVRAKCNAWLFRINKELEISTNPLFCLITYNEKNVPRTDEGLRTLRKKDIQDWLKRLRHHYAKISKKKIKYYIVGEYGSKKGRPHYHALILNLDNPELVGQTWDLGATTTPKLRIGEKNEGVRYMLKYISKPKTNKEKRQKEFSLCSKGIGANYLTPATIMYHKNRLENSFITTKEGHKIPIPKYYKEKIYSEEERYILTEYLQKRSEESKEKAIKEIMRQENHKNYEKAQTSLENRKNHLKFDKRNESHEL